jgi:tetratricopeptide (TPR) repeat protein
MQSIKLFILLTLLASLSSLAQERKDIFANPQNLKVLPRDISSGDLGATMKSFAMGLGVRCENCHVGEPNTPLATFDFESDEKAMKRKARVMLKMVQAINADYVPALNEIEDAARIEVRCVTCHRGRPQPKLIEDVLDEELALGGAQAAVALYGELREEYYGSHSYDFSEFSLPMYAQALGARGKAPAALEFARINTEYYPESYYSFFVLAELYEAQGNKKSAIEGYRRAAELNPRAKGYLDGRIAALNAAAD